MYEIGKVLFAPFCQRLSRATTSQTAMQICDLPKRELP